MVTWGQYGGSGEVCPMCTGSVDGKAIESVHGIQYCRKCAGIIRQSWHSRISEQDRESAQSYSDVMVGVCMAVFVVLVLIVIGLTVHGL